MQIIPGQLSTSVLHSFEVPTPDTAAGIGLDEIPPSIRNSRWLTGNQLDMLANGSEIPLTDPAFRDETITHIIEYYNLNPEEMETELHKYAAASLDAGAIHAAWQALLFTI